MKMRIFTLSLLAQTALANPVLLNLFERQQNSVQSVCSVSYTKSCTGSLATSATEFCASLGYGTTVSTTSITNTVFRTSFSTVTSYTSTSTFKAPTSTTTSSVAKTSTVTRISTVFKGTVTSSTVTVSATGTVQSCLPPGVSSAVPTSSEPTTTASQPATSNSPPTSNTVISSTPSAPSTTTPSSIAPSTSSSTTTSSGSSAVVAPSSTNTPPPLYGSDFTDCAQDNGTALNFVTQDSMFGPYEATYYVLCGGELVAPNYDNSFYSTQKPSISSCIAQCMADEGYGTESDNCAGVTWVQSGTGSGNCFYKPSNAQFVPMSDGSAATIPGVDSTSYLISARFYAFAVPAKRDVAARVADKVSGRGEVLESLLENRQAPPSKPACLKAGNAVQTTAACNCVIPSSTVTRTATQTSATTSTRTIINTKKLVTTITTTPLKTITTTFSTTVTTRTKTITTATTVPLTITTTVSWVLGPSASPAKFYISDDTGMFADWPEDADGLYYHVHYNSTPDADGFSPTVFEIVENSLQISDFIDDNGNPESLLVLGGPSADPGVSVLGMTNDQSYASPGGPYPDVVCGITANAQGQCPLLCNVGWNDVNARDADGLWYLLPDGTAQSMFTNFVVPVDD